jgi:hypothetical protein
VLKHTGGVGRATNQHALACFLSQTPISIGGDAGEKSASTKNPRTPSAAADN